MYCNVKFTCLALFLFQLFTWIWARIIEVDLEKSKECDGLADPFKINDSVLIVGILRARRATSTRALCIIKVSSQTSRTVVIKTKYLEFQGCGDRIQIFDQQKNRIRPKYSLNCDDKPEHLYPTGVSDAMVTYSKLQTETTSEIEIWIMTDRSEWLNKASWSGGLNVRKTRGTLQAGAIAGISVAVVVVVAVVIGLVVYAVRFKREDRSLHNYD